MHFEIMPESFFFSSEKGVQLKRIDGQQNGEGTSSPLLLSPEISSLVPVLSEMAGQLFLITMKKRERDYFGSGFPRDEGVHVIGRPIGKPVLMTVVLGRFAQDWDRLPLVDRAIPMVLSGRGPNPESIWSTIDFLKLIGAVSNHLWDNFYPAELHVGTSQVLGQFPETWDILSQIHRHELVEALLVLPVERNELLEAPHLLQWCSEQLEEVQKGLAQCEADRLEAVQVFEATIDEMMKRLRPLRDLERLHQAWLAANPELEPLAEPVASPEGVASK